MWPRMDLRRINVKGWARKGRCRAVKPHHLLSGHALSSKLLFFSYLLIWHGCQNPNPKTCHSTNFTLSSFHLPPAHKRSCFLSSCVFVRRLCFQAGLYFRLFRDGFSRVHGAGGIASAASVESGESARPFASAWSVLPILWMFSLVLSSIKTF